MRCPLFFSKVSDGGDAQWGECPGCSPRERLSRRSDENRKAGQVTLEAGSYAQKTRGVASVKVQGTHGRHWKIRGRHWRVRRHWETHNGPITASRLIPGIVSTWQNNPIKPELHLESSMPERDRTWLAWAGRNPRFRILELGIVILPPPISFRGPPLARVRPPKCQWLPKPNLWNKHRS